MYRKCAWKVNPIYIKCLINFNTFLFLAALFFIYIYFFLLKKMFCFLFILIIIAPKRQTLLKIIVNSVKEAQFFAHLRKNFLFSCDQWAFSFIIHWLIRNVVGFIYANLFAKVKCLIFYVFVFKGPSYIYYIQNEFWHFYY